MTLYLLILSPFILLALFSGVLVVAYLIDKIINEDVFIVGNDNTIKSKHKEVK